MYKNRNCINNNDKYNHVLNNLQDYMFSEEVMNSSIKYDFNKLTKDNTINYDNNNCNDNKSKNKNVEKYFIPNEKDTLFWCFFILKYGDIKYELEDKNILNEKKIKIDLIQKIRDNKNKLKKLKFDTLTNIENNLVNDNVINISTFFSLCYIENINIILLNESKKYYYELITEENDKDNNNILFYYIYDLCQIKKYGCNFNKSEIMIDHKENYFKIDNIEKPIKSLTSYKSEDLINICKRLNINTVDINTNKIKNKKQLYESIIQYF